MRIERPECEPPPGADAVGVVRDEIDAFERHAEPFGNELGEAGLVALAAVHRAEHQLDAALRADRHLGALARRAAGAFDVIGDADAAQLAVSFRRRLAGGKALLIGEPQAPHPCPFRIRHCHR